MNEGRYMISIDAVETREPRQVVVHDLEGGTDERCNIDQIKRRSRFHDLEWAVEKHYRLCAYCFPESADLS